MGKTGNKGRINKKASRIAKENAPEKAVFLERMRLGREAAAARRKAALEGSSARDVQAEKERIDCNKYIVKLSHNHRRMARAMFAQNLDCRQLAEMFKMNRLHVQNRIVASPVFRKYLDRLEEAEGKEQVLLRSRLLEMGDKAVGALDNDLDMKIDGHLSRRVRQTAARDVLDRIDVVGEAKRDRDDSPREVTNITQINIKELTIAEKHDLAAKLMQQPITI